MEEEGEEEEDEAQLDCETLAFPHGYGGGASFLDHQLGASHAQNSDYKHGGEGLDIPDDGLFTVDNGIAHALESLPPCNFASQVVAFSPSPPDGSVATQHSVGDERLRESFNPIEEEDIGEQPLTSLSEGDEDDGSASQLVGGKHENPSFDDASASQLVAAKQENLSFDKDANAAQIVKVEHENFSFHEEDGVENGLASLPFENFSEFGAGEEDEEGIKHGWEAARAWLWSLPRRRNVSYEEVEEWLQNNKQNLSREIVTMPRGHLFRFLVSQHKLMRRTEQMESLEVLEPPTARFRRSDKWKPVYAWLESLDFGSVVGAKVIDEWLSTNPAVKEELLGKHTRHHLFHYIQKCHANVIKKKKRELLNASLAKSDEKKKKKRRRKPKTGLQLVQADGLALSRPEAPPVGTASTIVDLPIVDGDSKNKLDLESMGLACVFKSEARRRYEILCELQVQLLEQIVQMREQSRLQEEAATMDQPSTSADPCLGSSARAGSSGADWQLEDLEGRIRRRSRDFSRARSSLDMKWAKKRKKGKEKLENIVLSWAYSEVLTSHRFEKGPSLASMCKDPSSSEKTSNAPVLVDDSRQSKLGCSLVRSLQEREKGATVGSVSSLFRTVGRGRCSRWKSYFEGWVSLESQFAGYAVQLQRKFFSSWLPCWSAYTSSVAVAAPLGTIDQGVQKVLDVRFHPQNLPQLVCSSNAAPNELLLYDLVSGKATELVGHNCQIQAVEYAANGERVISCGSNLVKIWDSTTGACLHTLGPGPWDENANGHKKKVNAMAVNQALPYIVATSGGHGDGQVLLWNINRGDLVCDLNGDLRNQCPSLPCMDALEFCDQHMLICGSDSSGGPAILQIWDVQAPQIVTSFPANDSYITSLKVDPSGQIIASGAGDGSVALTDLRTRGGISRMPVGSICEVTSVSFSSCGTYLQASSTSNRTIVWDMRMLPMEPGPTPIESPLPLADILSRKTRSLHCLSHGPPMPTSENAGQMPGFVDEGDQGVNDARWFHKDSLLVTVSGNGSIAMWDMSLGEPCVRHLTSHSRCVNTVAVSFDDKYICSGGDDQKVVLYENTRERSANGWRLTHPLSQEATMV